MDVSYSLPLIALVPNLAALRPRAVVFVGEVCAVMMTLALAGLAGAAHAQGGLTPPNSGGMPGKPGEAPVGVVIDRKSGAHAWSALRTAEAEPVWAAEAVPPGYQPVPVEKLGGLRIGQGRDAVAKLLGPAQASAQASNGEEVWQYIVRQVGGKRIFIASLWFNQRGLWMASGRSNPIGVLASAGFSMMPLTAEQRRPEGTAVAEAAPPTAPIVEAPKPAPPAPEPPKPVAPPAPVVVAPPPPPAPPPVVAPAPPPPPPPPAPVTMTPPTATATPAAEAPKPAAPPPAPVAPAQSPAPVAMTPPAVTATPAPAAPKPAVVVPMPPPSAIGMSPPTATATPAPSPAPVAAPSPKPAPVVVAAAPAAAAAAPAPAPKPAPAAASEPKAAPPPPAAKAAPAPKRAPEAPKPAPEAPKAAAAVTPAPVAAAPAAAAPSPARADAGKALREATEAWLDAWRRQDVDAYLAAYAPDFAPPGKTHAVWEKERRERVKTPVFVRVSADEVQVKDGAGEHPTVSFVQHYESERYEEKSRKALTFGLRGGKWVIEKEQNTALKR